jgi:hypothetical protein
MEDRGQVPVFDQQFISGGLHKNDQNHFKCGEEGKSVVLYFCSN